MRKLLAGALLVTAACGIIGSPLILATDVYEFRDYEGSDTVVFHWPRAAMPLRIWSDSALRPFVDTAIARWQGAFLYGEFRANVVSDSSAADVIVRNSIPDVSSGLPARAAQCVGETDLGIDLATSTAQLPMHVFVYAVVAEEVPGIPTCYSITTTHEFGHVLGIINPLHAGATPSDVMYANPVLDGLSDRDRLTINTVYGTPSTITISGRP